MTELSGVKLTKRKYISGDEAAINSLYKLLTGIERTDAQYRWEWIDTWNGQASMWLAFDENRPPGDQLIMQYSLIPTPITFWGKRYLAGKTENCMCHPEYRGKGSYFGHEKQFFPEAKNKYQLFFTTAGNAAGGAPGAVRRKLGYVALDSWVEYFFLTDINYIQGQIFFSLYKKSRSFVRLARLVSYLLAQIIILYFQPKSVHGKAYQIKLYDTHDGPLDEIEHLWGRNKKLYGISVDRTRSYIEWRINRNPFLHHKYLLLYEGKKTIGYVIFYKDDKNFIRIVDILADNKNICTFNHLLARIILVAKEEKAATIVCSTLEGNKLLKKVFLKNCFLRRESFTLNNYFLRKKEQKSFHIFITKSIPDYQKAYESENWYITDLVKEGR